MLGTGLGLFADENKNARRECDKVEQKNGRPQVQPEP
jgi:hypothetical protein